MWAWIVTGVEAVVAVGWIWGLYGTVFRLEDSLKFSDRERSRTQTQHERDITGMSRTINSQDGTLRFLREENARLNRIVEGTPGVVNDPVEANHIPLATFTPSDALRASNEVKPSGNVTVIQYEKTDPKAESVGIEDRVTALEKWAWGERP